MNKKANTKFGEKIEYYMEHYNPPIVTQDALADSMNRAFEGTHISQKTISLYLRGDRDIPKCFLERCIQFFKLNKKEAFELLSLALMSQKNIVIDNKKMKMIPESITRLIALVMSENIMTISDEKCDIIIGKKMVMSCLI